MKSGAESGRYLSAFAGGWELRTVPSWTWPGERREA